MEKFLLILGATPFTIPLIQAAKKANFKTVVCSNVPTDPGLLVADISQNVSILDRPALEQIVKKYEPEGIITAASDLATLSIGYLNDTFGLKGIKEHQVLSVTDKGNFIRLQLEEQLPLPQSITVNTKVPPAKQDIEHLGFPLIMKPFFSSGSRGVKKISDYETLCTHHNQCMDASSYRKGYVLQTFLSDFEEVGCEVFLENGEIIFIETTHKLLNLRQVPTGHCAPGTMSESDLIDLKLQIKQVCKRLGVVNSPINLDVMTRAGCRPIIIDLSFRLGGNLLPDIMQDLYKTSPYERVINYATNANFSLPVPSKSVNRYVGSLIFGSNKQQLFTPMLKAKIEKLFEEKLIELVFDFNQEIMLPQFTQGNKRFGHALVKVSSLSEYLSLHSELDQIIN